MIGVRDREIIEFAQRNGFVRPQDVLAMQIPRMYLQRLYEQGVFIRSGHGIYYLADADITENFSLAEVCKRVPHGVVCLLSALRFHEIGTQSPHEVWIAIDRKAHRPSIECPPLRVVRFASAKLQVGLQEIKTPDGLVRVTDPAKTVVDCFRYRNKIGLDVALEAINDFRRQYPSSQNDLWNYAKQLRISTVIRPYIEAVS